MAESSSTPSKIDKPVIVRVKRKASQSRVDAFWLEINERPLKRPLLDFGKLSISDSSTSQLEEPRTTKILVRHLETVTTSRETSVVLGSFLPNSSEALKVKEKNEERRFVKTVNKQDELLFKAKRQQEVLSRNARFEQIWRSRTEKKEVSEAEAVYDMYRVYDVVRVDFEEEKIKMQEEKNTDLEDRKIMSQFLPLLQDVLPSAAEEIEYDMQASSDGYVYDFYTVNKDSWMTEVDSASHLPLVQVDDDDEFYDGPDDDSDYQTDDSNAEDNPLNDYPEEEDTSEDEEEDRTSKSSEEKSEEDDETKTSGNESEAGESGSDDHDHDDSRPQNCSDSANEFFEDGAFSDGDCYDYGDTSDNDYGDEY